MLFITGLLTLLAIAQAGGDHIKGGSVTQQKVAQEDIIPSPFNVKSATTPFGTKVIQQEASDPLSKTARGSALHHAVKTAAATPGKTQRLPGLHHAASSPVIQDQVTISDPASGTIKSIKTLKTTATGKTRFSQQDIPMRDPIARPVVQTTKTIHDPISGTTQIKTVKMVDPVKTRFSQDDKQVRDPIALPVLQTVKGAEDPATLSTKRIKTLGAASTKTRFSQDPVAQSIVQSVKTSEDPSASVVTKTVKTTVKTAEPSNLRSKTSLKTAQQAVDLRRISNTPLSVVEAAKRNTLATSSAANAALLNSQRGSQSIGDAEGLLFNALADSEIQPETGIVNELGEMVLDEETLQTLQNAGGIITENGRIALNEVGINLLQSIRGGSLSPYSSGASGIGTSSIQSGATGRVRPTGSIGPSANIRSSSIRTSSAAVGSGVLPSGNMGMSRRTQTLNAPAVRSQVGGMRSRIISSSTTSSAGSSRPSGLSRSQSTPNVGSGVLTSNILSAQRSQGNIGATSGGSVVSGTALFNGKEISIDGLKEGQMFDDNLRPILSDIGRIDAPGNVVPKPILRTTQNVQSGVLGTSAVSGVTRSTTGSLRSTGVSGLRTTQNIRGGFSSTRIATPQRTSQGAGIAGTSGTLTSGTALFNGKEITIDGFKEGQMFDENLRPLTSGASISTSGQINAVPLRTAVSRPSARAPQRSQSTGLRYSTVTSNSRGAITSSRTSSTLLSQSVPNVRAGPLSTSVSSGQGRTQAVGSIGSGGPLRTGTVLFNGKEISVDGPREGQLFDENLRPIIPGTSISSSGQITGVPLRSTASRSGVTAPQRTQGTGLRSSTVSTSRGTIGSSRTSSALLSQSAPNVRPGSLNTAVTSGQNSLSGITSGGSLTSGAVLFNGKEISVDGLKEGQLFDENLRPLTPGSPISSSGQIRGVPSVSGAVRPKARAPEGTQSAGLRSSAVTSTSRRTITGSRRTNALSPQSGPLTTATIYGQQRPQAMGGVRSGQSLASGLALFNGKEISVDGLKEGQLFDENLKPITPGAPISSSGQIRGIPSRGGAVRPRTRAPQVSQSAGLRFSAVTSTSRRTITGSRATSALLSQSGPLTTATLSGQQRPLIMEGIRPGGTLASGTALLNGREISVDGLKEGQLFDENLKPISPGILGTIAEKPAVIRSSEEISNVPFENVALSPEAKLTQTGGLRSSIITNSFGTTSRGSSSTLSQPASISGVRPLSNVISSEVGISQADAALRSGGSLTSGTALFNGQEIRIDGLKEGQMFDENLQPILPVSAGVSPAILRSGQISGTPSRIASVPRPMSPQRPQSGTLRTSTISSSSSSSRSGSRSSNTLLTQAAPVVRAGTLSNAVSPQITGGIRQGGSLTSGAVLFDGRQINIDGLKEGQIFDENLQPILTDSSGITAERPVVISSSGQITGVPSRSTVLKPASRSPQRLQGGNLRPSSLTSSSRGAITSSGRTTTLSQFAPQRLRSGNLKSATITSSSGGANGNTKTSSSITKLLQGSRTDHISSTYFGGKDIRLEMPGGTATNDMLKNIKPIDLKKSAKLPRFSLTGGISPINEVPNALLMPQNLQPGRLMSSVTGGSSLSTFSSSRLLDGTAQNMGSGASIARGPLISSVQGGEITRSGDSFSSGTALFNGKEVNIDGLKAGQIYDENLRPISTGTSGSLSDISMNAIRSTQISGTSSSTIPKPRIRSPQRAGTAGLRSTVARGSSSGAFTSSRIATTSGSQSTAGSRANTISSAGRSSQTLVGARPQSSITSGTAIFNGKEINIDGLGEGQMFDENLRPISSGFSGALAGRMSTTLQRSRQISSVPLGGVALKPRTRSQVSSARSSVITNSARGATTGSRSLGLSQNLREGDLGTRIATTQRTSQAIGATRSASGSVLFDGKEISIDGLKPGQLYDENLRPITTGISGTVVEKYENFPGSTEIRRIPSQILAPKPRMRAPQGPQIADLRSPVVSSLTTSAISRSRTDGGAFAPNILSGALPMGTLPARGSEAGAEMRPGGTLTSGTALFDGKEIRIDGLQEGQLFDENLRPIVPGTSGTLIGNSASLSSSGQISGILPADITPKPALRPSQQTQANRMRSTSITSSRSAQSLSNVRAGYSSSGVPSPQGLPQAFGGARSSGSLTSGTVLFDGKEISIDGLKEGQLFDESLRPIGSLGGYTGNPDSVTNIQRSSLTRNLRTGTLSVTPGLRSQVPPTRNSPSALGSLNYIDVTRTDDSRTSLSSSENALGSARISSGPRNTVGGAVAYASPFGSKVTQDRITPEISQYGVDAPIQESILNIPDDPFKKSSTVKAPSISRQTQLKMEDVIEQSSLAKPDALRPVQVLESVPFSIPDSSKTASRKSLTKIAQLSQKDIDIPTVQQKLLGDFSGYLPKTSFLPPFNYALPQLSASKYRSPMSQVQQKMEQIFV